MIINNQKRQSEKGNVLFLILIAVALFAALSYVVTQSTRSGGGSTEREKNILGSAQMTQYPTALRTALIRMVLGGMAVENVKFNAPTQFSTITASMLVFHPQGGGATYQSAPSELSATGANQLTWYYNANFDVPSVGIDGSGGNDIVAFLPGVSNGVCKQVNEELGLIMGTCTLNAGVPSVDGSTITPALIRQSMTMAPAPAYTFPTGNQPDLQCVGGGTVFTAQASGCFYNSALPTDEQYVFYSVLLER